MYHPISEDDDDEYVELFNRGASAVSVGTWAFTAGISYTIPAGTSDSRGWLTWWSPRTRLSFAPPTRR